MLGYAKMKEVLLWVQTTQSAVEQFQYLDNEEPDNRDLIKRITYEVDDIDHPGVGRTGFSSLLCPK